MTIVEFESKLNHWGHHRVPFFFLIDFEKEKPEAWTLDDIPNDFFYSINELTNADLPSKNPLTLHLEKVPIAFREYKTKVALVKQRIAQGDSYLTNLTTKTRIELTSNLRDLFYHARAKYKVFWSNQFLCFSPETFVKISDGKIYSFPMKGTIDASVHDAEKTILKDPKELAEHVTIVDLIRNDLGSVSSNVEVKRFRYVEEIVTHQKCLLQVSSEICGLLPENYYSKIGTILLSLLPAGSVSGAPKSRTLEIIREAEHEKRGYYTGVAGIFDGTNLDSGVMIRFIEQRGNQFYYRSGGGITSQSQAESEYQEMIDKIYVPVY